MWSLHHFPEDQTIASCNYKSEAQRRGNCSCSADVDAAAMVAQTLAMNSTLWMRGRKHRQHLFRHCLRDEGSTVAVRCCRSIAIVRTAELIVFVVHFYVTRGTPRCSLVVIDTFVH